MTGLTGEAFRDEFYEALRYQRGKQCPRQQRNIDALNTLREELYDLRPKLPMFLKRVPYSELVQGRWVEKEANLEINLRKFGNWEIEATAQDIGGQIQSIKSAIVDEYQSQLANEERNTMRKGSKAILAGTV